MVDIIIIGAGIVGCHAARELSRDHEVLVLDKEGIAAGATGLSAGVVAPTLFYGDKPEIARHSNAFFRDFDGTHGFEFTERPRLDLVTENEEPDKQAEARSLSESEFPVSYLDAEAVEHEYPTFTLDDYVGAVEYLDAGWVDPYTYASALAKEAHEQGAEFETDVVVESIRSTAGAVTGVETDIGQYEAETVLLAAGWGTQSLLPSGIELPIRPYRTQVVVLDPDDPVGDSFPIARIADKHLYFRPEQNGDLLIGGAHYLIENPDEMSASVDESFKLDVAEFIPSLLKGFRNAGFVNGWAGVDTATPDARPIIDSIDMDGLVVATGFNGLGIMASPVIGPTVRERITGETPSFPTEPFELSRFTSTSSDFEYISTSDIR